MTIDEAIKRQTPYADGRASVVIVEDIGAFKLGIEALKRIQVWRDGAMMPKNEPLPGETKD